MKIHTMAMQISEKNWSVAAAIIGSEITDKPMADSYGHYVVINSFDASYVYRSGRFSHAVAGLTLRNFFVEVADFQTMFEYDKRTKNLENFFEVTQVANRPLKIHPDQKLDQAIQDLNEAWTQED